MNAVEQVGAVIPAPIRAEVDDWSDAGAFAYLGDFGRLAAIERRCRRLDWMFAFVGAGCILVLVAVGASFGFLSPVGIIDLALACIHAVVLQRHIRRTRERRRDFNQYALIALYITLTRGRRCNDR